MYVITFKENTPNGFAPITVDINSFELCDCLHAITDRYLSNNLPEVVLGDTEYYTYGVNVSGEGYTLGGGEYLFTVVEADTL